MDHAQLALVLAPLETAKGLPNSHYVCKDTFQVERDRLLFANWSGVAFGKDIPQAGDAMPFEFVGMPLLAVRQKDDSIKVFQNTCRHRGMILVSEKRNIGGVIRCPYHSWCYSTEGPLVTTPHVGGPGQNTHPDLDRAQLGLIEIRSHVWRDIIFVNVDGSAPEFAEYAASAIEAWTEYEDQPLHFCGEESAFGFEVACNWKLAVENYCESYHLPWVHPGLNSYSRLEDHYHIERPGAHSGQGTLVYRPMLDDAGLRFPDFKALSDKWDAGAEYIALYPNVLLGVHRDHAFAIILEPQGPEQTYEHVALYYAASDVADDGMTPLRRKNAAMWHEVFSEDIFVVEGMQTGRRGVHFDGGRFSPAMDGPTHCFHSWVASRMIEGAAPSE